MEAEKRAWVAEQLGREDSLIKELRLFETCFAKPSSSTLTAADGSILATDYSKLERWAEHFTSVVNGGMDVSQASLDSLPVVPLSIQSPEHLDTDNLCAPLSKEEISDAIS